MFATILFAVGLVMFLAWAMMAGALVVSLKRIVTGPRRRYHLLTAIWLGMLTILPIHSALTMRPHSIGQSKTGAAMGDIGALNSALQLYQTDVKAKRYPSTIVQLVSDSTAGWDGPYMATITPDPWNNQYIYTTNGISYT